MSSAPLETISADLVIKHINHLPRPSGVVSELLRKYGELD